MLSFVRPSSMLHEVFIPPCKHSQSLVGRILHLSAHTTLFEVQILYTVLQTLSRRGGLLDSSAGRLQLWPMASTA